MAFHKVRVIEDREGAKFEGKRGKKREEEEWNYR